MPRACNRCKLPLRVERDTRIPVHPDGFIICDPKEVERASQAR